MLRREHGRYALVRRRRRRLGGRDGFVEVERGRGLAFGGAGVDGGRWLMGDLLVKVATRVRGKMI